MTYAREYGVAGNCGEAGISKERLAVFLLDLVLNEVRDQWLQEVLRQDLVELRLELFEDLLNHGIDCQRSSRQAVCSRLFWHRLRDACGRI